MLSFLYVYSDHSILECYNLFSGVELSMRSFFVISIISGMFNPKQAGGGGGGRICVQDSYFLCLNTNQSHGTCTVVTGLQLGKLHRGGGGGGRIHSPQLYRILKSLASFG